MPDGPALSLTALVAVLLVVLALVWPQGQGARSPPPFGHRLAALPSPIAQIARSPLLLRGPETPPKPPARPRAAPPS
jgi:hypothetical protein